MRAGDGRTVDAHDAARPGDHTDQNPDDVPTERASAAVLVCQDGRRPLTVVVDGRLDVGRECDGLLVADERVSRLHLRLELVDDRVVVSDLGSSNGTFLNGAQLRAPTVLDHGSIVRLGSTSIRLVSRGRRRRNDPDHETWLTSAVQTHPVPAGGLEATVRRTGIGVVADAVADQHDLLRAAGGSGDDTVTIVFSDIESSTEWAVALGDERWYELLRWHNRLVTDGIGEAGGRVVKNQGDGYLATFTSARRAVLASARIQQNLAATRPPGDDPPAVRVRIGCHTGEVITSADGDVYGRHVIVAARVADLAAGSEVLVSSITHDITAPRGDLPYGSPRTVALKGLATSAPVHPLDWAAVDLDAVAGPLRPASAPRPRQSRN